MPDSTDKTNLLWYFGVPEKDLGRAFSFTGLLSLSARETRLQWADLLVGLLLTRSHSFVERCQPRNPSLMYVSFDEHHSRVLTTTHLAT